MGIRRSGKGYEEMDGANVPNVNPNAQPNPNGISNNSNGSNLPSPEFELASVSVVPDDTYTVSQAVNALGFGWFQVRLSLFVGLCWMSDSMEMTILSVLGPALHCDWGISRYQQAMVTTVVFLGRFRTVNSI